MEVIKITDRNELYGEKAKYEGYNFFIEASAGAGKTETIINLIIKQLYNGVSPEKIVAITFTNKATEELLDRISSIILDKLNELKNDSIKNKDKIDILQNALDNLYKMNVSTIHHFCNVILSENSYKAKLSFNPTLLEEDDENKRRDKFYYKWVHDLDKDKLKEIANCVVYDSKNNKKNSFYELKKTYDELCEQFDDIKIRNNLQFDYENFLIGIFQLYDELKKYEGKAAFSAAANNFINAFKEGKDNFTGNNYTEIFEKYINLNSVETITKKIQLNKRPVVFLSSNEIEQINNNITPLRENCKNNKELTEYFLKNKDYEIINKYALKAWDDYKKARDRESLCNNQLIYETYDLINKNLDVKEKLANKYDVIFVDEFQDTDKYQNKFIMDLAKAIDERKASDGITSTSIVVVGDPKQSIYGFRGADFTLFMDERDNFSKCGLRKAINVLLPDNYRSNQYILNWVNDTYRDKSFYSGYKYEDMIMPKENEIPTTSNSDALGGVYSFNFNGGDNKFIRYASLVKAIKEKKKIYKRNKNTGELELQDINYSDFLILTTSHVEINQFIVEFNKLNIKMLVAGEFYLSSSPAIGYIYRILMRLLDKENNNRRLFNRDFNYNIYDEDKINDIENKIREYSPYGKLLYVLNNINLILEEFTRSDKELLKTILQQICENVCFDNSVSSVEILDAFEKLVNNKQDAELSLEPNEDAVRIMNIHKAKGLTSEIVIVADSGGFNTGNGCKVLKDTIYLHNLELYPENDEYNANQEAEKLRLEYVASTRAKQVMIFESEIESNKQLFNRDNEKYNLTELDNYHIIESTLPQIEVQNIEDIKISTELTKKGIEKVSNDLSNTQYIELTPSELEKKQSSTERVKYKRPSNNIFGTIFHRVMELYALNKDESIKTHVDRAINENRIDILDSEIDEYRKYLIQCAEATISLYNKENLFSLYNTIEPEYKFTDFGDYLGKSTLVTGSIDLLLKNNDSILIIDYKTNSNKYDTNLEFEEKLKVEYEEQLKLYKEFISKSENKPLEKIETKIVWLEEKDVSTEAHFLEIL